MTKDRLKHLKYIVNTDYSDRLDAPQMYFSVNDLKYLIEQAEKVESLQEEIEHLENKLKTAVAFDVDYKPTPKKIIKL